MEQFFKDIEAAMSGEESELTELRKSIMEGEEKIIKQFTSGESNAFQVDFLNGEVVGGRYLTWDKPLEFSQEQAQLVAYAYDIHELD